MKKFFKNLIKEAVLEALREWFYPVNTRANLTGPDGPGNGNGNGTGTETGEGDGPKTDENLNNGEDPSGKGGNSEASSGGGITDDGSPKPDVGVGVFSRRK